MIYEAHVRGLTMRHRTSPRSCAAVRGHRLPADDRLSDPARGDRHRVDAGAPVHPRQPAGRPGAEELLGLQHHRLLRPHHGYSALGRTGQQVQEFRGMVRRCTRPASRSSSTWSTTTPPRATTSGRR
ncbi:hypothetical protein NKG94_12660 [Micromonospora sp. M12]